MERFRVPLGDGVYMAVEWSWRKGERLTIEGVNAFIYEDEGGDWKIYEESSGYALSFFQYEHDAAVEEATRRLREAGPDKVRELIANAIAKTGLANPAEVPA